MAMCGAFLGPLQVVAASVASLLVGGVIGVVWLSWQFSSSDEKQLTTSSAIPYALAIGVGVLISLKTAPMILLTLHGGASA
jgi:Flp pilus assembly protein protease CpaA